MTILQPLSRLPNGLFWTAALSSDSDFTAEDPLALDYLAQQVGLWLFRGFTTRTARAQNYVVVLYGLYLADKAAEKFGYPGDDETRTKLFERWERFWALATLECRMGQLSRGDEDAMRGIRGAKRAWFPGNAPLPADFSLISRQIELGGLGAYLSSLREYGLVLPGTLRVAPSAREILEAFWSEKAERDMSGLYENYVLEAMAFDSKTIPRSKGRLTLGGLGDRSRLSCFRWWNRRDQQGRLWNTLFVNARDDSTLLLAECVIAARKSKVEDPEQILEGMIDGRWRPLPSSVRDKVEVALLFGRVARLLLGRFNRAYRYIEEHGWVADIAAVAAACFPGDEAEELSQACWDLLNVPGCRRFAALQFHGPDFLALIRRLVTSGPTDSLEHLLAFHRAVQRSRRGGGAWLRAEHGKLLMQVPGYAGYTTDAGFPSFKLNVVRQLLEDLGKLP
ncbi:hypothetical protein P5Y53_19235 [Dyella jiangningensis]|uniref:hypothetical protein n=1 Tax=Dyella jiangningensis TaxID=1379159 RepID=UPI00240FE7AB|nr:hypothetical protein [Dyella jiangningensis]MDG2539821.1 hypothetical protein [Dyella jiangningensis]